jgi:hypothetical protein
MLKIVNEDQIVILLILIQLFINTISHFLLKYQSKNNI